MTLWKKFFENIVRKEKMLITSIFCFSHNVSIIPKQFSILCPLLCHVRKAFNIAKSKRLSFKKDWTSLAIHDLDLTLYHTIPIFNDPNVVPVRGERRKFWLPAFYSLFHKVFYHFIINHSIQTIITLKENSFENIMKEKGWYLAFSFPTVFYPLQKN